MAAFVEFKKHPTDGPGTILINVDTVTCIETQDDTSCRVYFVGDARGEAAKRVNATCEQAKAKINRAF